MQTMSLRLPTIDELAEIDLAPPTVACFGRYEVLAPLGDGGDARVYVGQTRGPTETRRLVAIKHVTSELPHPQVWKAAAQEAALGARIRHANVVGVLEVEDGGIGPYIIMDYVEGGTLVDLLSRCFERSVGRAGLPVGIAVRIALDALFGLHAAHELRDEKGRSLSLVHRDVSPHNILVGTDGVSRISDFGIARIRHAIRTAPGLVRGKAGYMAPEQILGQPLDRRTDVFAMGIVLWEALTGNRLFRGKRLEEVIASVMEQPILSPSHKAEHVPAAVSAICLRALERDPRKRWPSARAFADALAGAARSDRGTDVATQGEVADYLETALSDVLERRRSILRLAEANEPHPDEDGLDNLTVPRQMLPVADDVETAERPLWSAVLRVSKRESAFAGESDKSVTVQTRRQKPAPVLAIVAGFAALVMLLAVAVAAFHFVPAGFR